MKATSRPRTAYHRLVRSFDHSDLVALPCYPALRQALGDIDSQVAINELTSASTTTQTVHAPTRPHAPQTN